MSSQQQYRPSFAPRYGGWREREAMKEKQRKELEQRRKEEAERAKLAKTEENFPALSSGPIQQARQLGEDSFAEKAAEWKFKDDIAEIRENARQERELRNEQRERIMRNGIYIMSRAQLPQQTAPLQLPVLQEEKKPVIDRDGFEVVEKKKLRKPKRELTEAELAAKHDRQLSDDEDDELNGDLLESSYRRDHY